MRKFLSLFIFLFVLVSFNCSAFAEDVNIKDVGFTDMSLKNKNSDIRVFFKDFLKFSVEHNLDELLGLYDDEYLNSDGIDKKTLFLVAKDVWAAFPNVKYSQKIQFLNAEEENATVVTQESLRGDTSMSVDYLPGNAYLDSDAVVIYYLKKVAGEWKIVSDTILHEKTALKYGAAKNINMSIEAPSIAAENTDYTASLRVDVPKEYIAMISINNEAIKYPMVKPDEVFRSIKSNVVQERILKVNKEGKNENAIASVGLAEAFFKDNNVNIKIKGIALLTTRVNVVKDCSKKETKKDETRI